MNISKATKDTISITLVIGSNLTAVIKKREGEEGGGAERKEKKRREKYSKNCDLEITVDYIKI